MVRKSAKIGEGSEREEGPRLKVTSLLRRLFIRSTGRRRRRPRRPWEAKLTSSARARRVGTALQKQASSRVYRFYDRASLAVLVRPSFPLVF